MPFQVYFIPNNSYNDLGVSFFIKLLDPISIFKGDFLPLLAFIKRIFVSHVKDNHCSYRISTKMTQEAITYSTFELESGTSLDQLCPIFRTSQYGYLVPHLLSGNSLQLWLRGCLRIFRKHTCTKVYFSYN